MKRMLTILSLAILSLVCMQISAAVKVVECEDEQGNRSFQSACPPGSILVDEKKIPTGDKPPPPLVRKSETDDEAGSANINATLYYIPECGPCDEVREFFQLRQVSFTEKDVNENIEVQNELKELRGSLKVPATVIGEKVITGYNRSELIAALEAAGYKEKKAEAEAETE
jgi:glutaredoxin